MRTEGFVGQGDATAVIQAKTKRTSQYANEHGLPRPDSARFEHGGGSTSNTKCSKRAESGRGKPCSLA